MDQLLYTPYLLSVYKLNPNLPPNKFRDEFYEKYSVPISKLHPSQQKEIHEITKLAYKAGMLDAKRKYKIKKRVEYEDDDEDEFN